MSASALEVQQARDVAHLWWIYLVTGACWLLFAVLVFRFDWTTVSAISILFGIVMLAAGAAELVGVFTGHGWWRLVSAVLAVAFIAIGIVAFVHPGNTFAALAAVISFYFIIKGGFDIAIALADRKVEHWWLRLVLGLAEVLLGFWAAGYFGNRVILLVVWVGAVALTRGIIDIVTAFALRSAAAAEED